MAPFSDFQRVYFIMTQPHLQYMYIGNFIPPVLFFFKYVLFPNSLVLCICMYQTMCVLPMCEREGGRGVGSMAKGGGREGRGGVGGGVVSLPMVTAHSAQAH
jgi:hypothetical protein